MVQGLPEGTVTVLFTDVQGSTALAATEGDEAARDWMRACEELTREQLGRHRGLEVKGTGDGLMAAFSSARRAVTCAIEIQRAIERRNLARPEQAIRLRIGLNSGEVIRERQDLFGSTVNAAARIEAAAEAGQILIAESVRLLLGAGSDIALTNLGEFELRGFEERWRLFEVDWQEPAGAPATPRRSPFVGRDAEHAELRRLLGEAGDGRGALAMVAGEPGVGKTRLTQELIADARARGFLTLAGHCYEMEGAPPYVPFIEVIETTARTLDVEVFREMLGEEAPQAAKLVPRLRQVFPDMPPAPDLPPEQERRYLLDSLRDYFERLASSQPLLLVLEDLHWADEPTLLLVQHLVQRVADVPLLIVGTYRQTDLSPERPLAGALPNLIRQESAVDILLGRLAAESITAMLRAYGGTEPPPSLLELIFRETEGNPFFVEQVLKHLTEAGRIFDEQGQWRSDVEVAEHEVPRGVRIVIGQRLERVSGECRRALSSAAVLGRAFTYELLRELAEIAEEETLLRAMDEAEDAQLVSPEAVGGELRLTFAHELIRQTLLADLSLPRRQRLHLRAADAIEAAAGDATEERASALAHHLYQAGATASPERTVRYLSLAGEQAMGVAAFDEARRLFERALNLHEHGVLTRADLLMGLGRALWASGSIEQAVPTLGEAADLALQAGQADLAARAVLTYEQVATLASGGELAHSTLPLLEAARELQTKSDTASQARILARMSTGSKYVAPDSPFFGQSQALSKQSLEIARGVNDTLVLADALRARYLALWEPEFIHERLQVAAELVEVATESGDDEQQLWAHGLMGFDLSELGEYKRFDPHMRAFEEISAQSGFAFHRRLSATTHAARCLLEGRFEEAQAWLARARDIEVSPAIPFDVAMEASLAYEQGRLHELAGVISPALMPFAGIGAIHAALALANIRLGHREEAAVALDTLLSDGFPLIEQDQDRLPALAALSEVAVALGRRDQAERLRDGLIPYEGRNASTLLGIHGSSYRHLGLLEELLGRGDEAAQHFEDALDFNRRMDALPFLAHTQRQYAALLIRRDSESDPKHARDLLAQAAATYRELGMSTHLKSAEAMLVEGGD